MATPLPVWFVGGARGAWHIESVRTLKGEPLGTASHLDVVHTCTGPEGASFTLRGSTGHVRYVNAREKAALADVTPPLGRPEATCAALIPIGKSDVWWELAQDERRAILEERSRHIGLGLEALPAIARRLYHCRELGEPFDFLTWFEFAPGDATRFDSLLSALRATEEWEHVEREVELRLSR